MGSGFSTTAGRFDSSFWHRLIAGTLDFSWFGLTPVGNKLPRKSESEAHRSATGQISCSGGISIPLPHLPNGRADCRSSSAFHRPRMFYTASCCRAHAWYFRGDRTRRSFVMPPYECRALACLLRFRCIISTKKWKCSIAECSSDNRGKVRKVHANAP